MQKHTKSMVCTATSLKFDHVLHVHEDIGFFYVPNTFCKFLFFEDVESTWLSVNGYLLI